MNLKSIITRSPFAQKKVMKLSHPAPSELFTGNV